MTANIEDTLGAELDALDPPPLRHTLSTGVELEFQDLKTRQFFRLMRIITRGAGPLLMDFPLSVSQPADEFMGRLMALVVMAIPEAEDESLSFIMSMVRPADLVEAETGKPLPDVLQKRNEAKWDELRRELYNPELEDLVDLIEIIVRREARDIQRLGKRLQRMFEIFQKTGQDRAAARETAQSSVQGSGSEQSPSSTPTDSLEPSLPPSTLSPQSMVGPTANFSSSQSSDFVRSPQQSLSDTMSGQGESTT